MSTPSASIRAWAERLLAEEAAKPPDSAVPRHEAVRVLEKLRLSLGRFAGADGFTALLRRALALARAEMPPLRAVTVTADGRLEGLDELLSDTGNALGEAAVAITAHLLELLVVFVGEPLTLRLVREAWPGVSLSER